MGLFKQLFKDAQNENVKQFETLQPGELFPYGENSTVNIKSNAVFLSLTCQDCIELITAIKEEFSKGRNVKPNNLSVYVIASNEEVKELDSYFNSMLSIQSISKEELVQKYKVPSTPFCYHINNDNRVLRSSEFDNIISFIKILITDPIS